MYKEKRIVAIIPARGGSKRIPKKNIKLLAGKPLIAYSIDQANNSEIIDEVIVNSDSQEILDICKRYKCKIQKREEHLATDSAKTTPVLQDTVKKLEEKNNFFDILVLLQPTSPFRTTKIIDECIKKLIDEGLDSVQTVTNVNEHPSLMFTKDLEFKDRESFFDKKKREDHYILNGAVYVTTIEALKKNGLYGEENKVVVMRKEISLDIDTMDDWTVAQKNMETRTKMLEPLIIADKKIGYDKPVFIIAEAGVNHNGDIKLAKKLIDVAVDAKVDAVKFQTFNAQTGTSKYAEKTAYQKTNDGSEGTYKTMLEKLQLSEEQFKELHNYAKEKGILFMSTASDGESLEILKRLHVSAYKIGSGHITNIPLLKDTAKEGKPMIVSVGMATFEEIDEAIDAIKSCGNEKIVLLHCVSQYPTPYQDANLNVITTLKNRYPMYHIGYSDHTLGIEAVTASIALGACVIEKHITLDKTMKGPDHKASLEPKELKNLVEAVRNITQAMGDGVKRRTQAEEEVARKARRSIVAHIAIPKGTTITEEMLRMKKPETGIKPKFYWDVIGKIAQKDIEEDKPLQWEDITDGKEA